MKSKLLAVAVLACACAQAQTKRTEFTLLDPSRRDVDGRTYAVDSDPAWKYIEGHVEEVALGGVVLRQLLTKSTVVPQKPNLRQPIIDRQTGELRPNPQSYGGFVGGVPNPKETGPLIKTDKVAGGLIFLTNFSAHAGASVACRALPVGKHKVGSRVLQTYDYGLPHVTRVTTSSRVVTNTPAHFTTSSRVVTNAPAKENGIQPPK